MIDDFLDLLPGTIRHAKPLAFDAFGRVKAWSAETSYAARVTYRHRLVRDKTGNQVVARGEAWIAGAPTIGLSDRLTLPDGSTPSLIAVEIVGDEIGPHHTKAFFG